MLNSTEVKSNIILKKQKEKGFQSYILKRRFKRPYIFGTNILLFSAGDIVSVFLEVAGLLVRFKGICISIRGKSLGNVNCSFRLRNIVNKVGIEITIPLYRSNFNLSSLAIYDYERKRFRYRSSKLYYLRNRSNRSSLVRWI